MDTDLTTTATTIELQLVDVVVRHELERVALDVSDFGTWDSQRYWRAITTLWEQHAAPTLAAVHDQLCTESSSNPHRCSIAADIMSLPLGYRDLLDDYIAVIGNASRRRRLGVLLVDAAEAIASGADPDAVLARITALAS